jgi:ATP adenylyltransferase
LQRLFAPWRYAFLSETAPPSGCFFCRAARGEDDDLTLHRGERAMAMLNRYPYTSGHVMVAPREHTADLAGMDAATLAEMMALTQRLLRALEVTYHPHGCNIGMNLGEAAGAGVVDHLHMHLVPRWRGDTNFMAVAGDVRVLPEELTTTGSRLRQALETDRG